MPQHTTLLLSLWRDASQHLQIQDFAVASASELRTVIPFDELLIREIDFEHQQTLTVAGASRLTDFELAEQKHPLTASDCRRLKKWVSSDAILTGQQRYHNLVRLLTDRPSEGDHLAIPLSVGRQQTGVLFLTSRLPNHFGSDIKKLLLQLREPFVAALEHHYRLHELAILREAAEAERGTLLRKLGRTDLSDVIVGENTGLKQVMKRAQLVSKLDVPVLILGETGTGKEVVARAIHNHSGFQEGPFIRVNCGAIPPELIDSQLFGHEKGSFTGADQTRQGWFERADGGTLFLDEVGELPLDAQVRFLRVLQDGFVERVGGASPIHVQVRIIAATHRDLSQMVRSGQFREDLWYRLAVFPIQIPPLRDRVSDIPSLASHFTERAAMRFGLPLVNLSEHDLGLLQGYHWPGNIRELGAVIDRAVILGEGKLLEIEKSLGLPEASQHRQQERQESSPFSSLEHVVRQHIIAALELSGGKVEGRQGAAELLEINPHTLRAKMRKLKINWSSFRDD